MPNPARRDILLSASALALLPALTVPAKAQGLAPADERRVSFDDGWKFAFGNLDDADKDFGWGKDQRTYAKQGPDSGNAAQSGFDDSGWQDVTLPHDWAVALPFVHKEPNPPLKPDDHGAVWDPAANHGYKPLGRDYPETSIGWYRKSFGLTPTDKGKKVFLEFDGVFRACVVMINGYIVKQHDGGYTPFAIDISDFLNTDDKPNVVAVRVDASLGEGWFYEGAGLYRHVWLVKTNPVYIPQYGVCVRAKTDGTVEVTTTVCNDTDQTQTLTIIARVAPATENDVPGFDYSEKGLTIAPFSSADVTQTVKSGIYKLWSLDDPRITYAMVEINDAQDSPLDYMPCRFGFRDIRFDPDSGFFLNGQSVKLKGTCNHQDHAGVGSAVPDAIQRFRLQTLKSMGCNAIRTAHNPPTPELLDMCDEMGILVIDETRMMTSSQAGLDDLATMIRRDRNHPSVIQWSIGNEEPQQGTERGAIIARHMKRVCNDLDPTRLITAAMDSGYGKGISDVLDVIGFNYRDQLIDAYHTDHPHQPIIGTETASTVSTRGEYIKNDAAHIVPAYDTTAPWWATTAEGWWPHFDAKPFIGGGFIWTGFDYRGEPTPYSSWPSISSQFGVVDTCGFPKDAYYYYRAWWRDESLLHLFPHWNWQAGDTVAVWAYSNADEVELFVNGRSAGKKAVAKDMHVQWDVLFAPGKIEAFAYKAGKVILKDMRETTGAPAKIVLSSDRTQLTGDGRDCAVITATVVDAKGRMVPNAGDMIRFSLSGPAEVIGVGNGDPNCHEADKASQRSAFNGLCCAIVQTRAAGAIKVTATAAGLVSGVVKLKAV
ncbi:beta-galactosidase GalA [Asticcacaulis sp. EMRT-3]|uniref:beta-galactosidase GalA n=1 Tax=Asticcacaulis sp. EMRT-3 TaxID=3040349 RepID=UPI0024AEDD25|nr:beta-galactosidase GalA [Asticcacaulis sp. EMRT-3]MDI7775864.1 beta-galactosidase GalA [Asticcacaulis sp. EMRT-3]